MGHILGRQAVRIDPPTHFGLAFPTKYANIRVAGNSSIMSMTE